MSIAIVRPTPYLDAIEALGLRDTFVRVLDHGCATVIVDLTGVQELSAAGLAAVTNFLTHGRRRGFSIRVLLPEDGTQAARTIDQADLSWFLSAQAPCDAARSEQAESIDASVVRHTSAVKVCAESLRMRHLKAGTLLASPSLG